MVEGIDSASSSSLSLRKIFLFLLFIDLPEYTTVFLISAGGGWTESLKWVDSFRSEGPLLEGSSALPLDPAPISLGKSTRPSCPLEVGWSGTMFLFFGLGLDISALISVGFDSEMEEAGLSFELLFSIDVVKPSIEDEG
jgi:hypothetical protein